MATSIKTWQIVNGSLKLLETSLAAQGRSEPQDLEAWIASEPAILGPDILLIGRQVPTQSGPLDLLGIDRSGNTVIVELKAVRQIVTAHEVQLVNYLAATGKDIGLILNFGPAKVGVRRKLRNLPDEVDF